ncbi:MAG: CHAT domain-containing protein [Ardenticatenaceae bacterium]|nr:CHAT domain-containing protein [Ardenticatenaceae bacterium]
MTESLTVDRVVNDVLSARSQAAWQATLDQFGPQLLRDPQLLKQLQEKVTALLDSGQRRDAETLVRWHQQVLEAGGHGLKVRLMQARSEAEIRQLLEQHRPLVGAELVLDALREVSDLFGPHSPYPPPVATQLARRILAINLIISRFLADEGLQAACLKERSQLSVRSGDLPAAVADLRQAEALFRQAGDAIERGRCLGLIGSLLRQQGQPQEGLVYLLEAAGLFQNLEAVEHLGITYQELALIYHDRGDAEQERVAFEKALQSRLASEQWPQAVHLLILLASEDLSGESLERAYPHCQKIIDLYQGNPGKAALPPLPPELIELMAQTALGAASQIHAEGRYLREVQAAAVATTQVPYTAYIDQQRIQPAQAWLALAAQANALSPSRAAQAYLGLAEATLSLSQPGGLERVLDKVQESLPFFEEQDDYWHQSLAFRLQVEALHRLGRLDQAIAGGENALALARQQGDRRAASIWLAQLGALTWESAQLDRCLAYLNEGLQLAQEGQQLVDRTNVASIYGLLGKVYLDLGDLEQAVTATTRAYTLARDYGHKRGQASELQNLAELLIRTPERPERNVLAEILPVVMADVLGDDPTPVARMLEMDPDALRRTLIIRMLERSAAILGEINDLLRQVNALHALANHYPAEDPRGLQTLQDVLRLRRALGDRNREAYTLGSLAALYGNLGQSQQAKAHFQQSLEIAREGGFFDCAYKVAKELGRLSEAEGDPQAAERYYAESVALIEAARENVPFTDLHKVGFGQNKLEAYDRLVALYLAREAYQEAFVTVQRAKSRALLEITGATPFEPTAPREGRFAELLAAEAVHVNALGQARDELRAPTNAAAPGASSYQHSRELAAIYREMEAFDPEYVAVRRGLPADVARLESWLRSQARPILLVEYFYDGRQLSLFFLRAGWQQVAVHQAPLSSEELWSGYQDYQREVVRYRSRGSRSWTRLANRLVVPLENHLQPGDLIYLIPHRLLHGFPIHALPLGGRPLIARHPVAYAPAAGLLPLCQLPGKGTDRLERCVAFGIVFEEEAEQVAALFGTQAVRSSGLTRAEVARLCRGQDVCHFSCHGYFNPMDPLSSGLLIQDVPPGDRVPRQALLTARDIMGMNVQAELICLSACQTGLNQVSEGDELLGLIRAFLYAGGSSLVVSLWSVDAARTQALMTAFYTHLLDQYRKQGVVDKALALQQAQLELMAQEGERNAFYWAPFVLIGDWR